MFADSFSPTVPWYLPIAPLPLEGIPLSSGARSIPISDIACLDKNRRSCITYGLVYIVTLVFILSLAITVAFPFPLSLMISFVSVVT